MELCLSNRRKIALVKRVERNFDRAVSSLFEIKRETMSTFNGKNYRELEIEGMVNNVLRARKLLKDLLKEAAKDLETFHEENE